MRLPKRSLRTTLTLWNAAALTGLMGAFGLALVFTNENRLRAAIDDDLFRQASRAAGMGPPPLMRGPRRGGMGGMRGPGTGLGSGEPGDDGPTLGAGPGEPFQDGPPDEGPGGNGVQGGPPRPDPFREAERLADVRRPRFFNRDRQPLNPGESTPPFENQSLALAIHGRGEYRTIQMNGQAVRVYSHPMLRDGQVVGAVQVARELTEVDMLWQAQMRTLLLLLPVAVLVAGAGAYAFTNRALRPIQRVTLAAAEISHSDLSRRLEVSGDDELAELGRTFNEMLARLERSFGELATAYDDLTRAYEQQQRFTADASHELRTPLTRLKLATSSALSKATSPDEMREALLTADRAASSMTRLVQQLLTLARADAGNLGLHSEPVDLRVLVAEALESASPDRTLESFFDETPVMVSADAEHVKRVVSNLVENAIRHTPKESEIRVETLARGAEAQIVVRDTGEGIPAEHLPHLSERFYRVDSARTRRDGGSGLGLAICKNIVEAHGGRLEIESTPGEGTTVRVFFPLFSPKPESQTKSS